MTFMKKCKRFRTLAFIPLLSGLLMLQTPASVFAQYNTAEEKAASRTTKTSSNEEKEPNPFTPDGNGTLLDEADSSQNKLFFTVTTKNNNTFFLVIDKDRTSDNVYMLSTIDERDLKDFIEEEEPTASTADPDQLLSDEQSSLTGGHENDTSSEKPDTNETAEDKMIDEPAEKPTSKLPMTILLVALAAIAACGYSVIKKKLKDPYEEEADETEHGMEEEIQDSADETESNEDEEILDDEYNEDAYPDPSHYPDESGKHIE